MITEVSRSTGAVNTRTSIVERADRYLRGEDTRLSRIASRLSPKGHKYLDSWQKRLLVDIPVGLVGGIFTFPLTATLCAAVWVEDGRPIFYKDTRMGKDGTSINVWKIRSMRRDADKYSPEEIEKINLEAGPADDPRNTRVGRLLRRFELDEMPQFWQIARGDFSMCGIRVMNPKFHANMAKFVDPRDMEHWQEAYDRCRGVFNPNASRQRFRKDDKKRVHDDLLYDRKASLGLDYYLLIITSLRMLETFKDWLSARSYSPLKEVEISGIPITVSSETKDEWRFAMHFLNELRLDHSLLEMIREQGVSGHFLDIGASTGIYSSFALRCGMEVTAVEPHPQSFARLGVNASLNEQYSGQYCLIDVAISDESGKTNLYSDGFSGGCPSLKRTLDQSSSLEVKTTTIDELILKGTNRPTIIKIDVEGAEMLVLSGGLKYFSSPVAADVFIEIHPDFLPLFGSSEDKVIHRLTEDFGYRLVSRLPKQNEHIYHFSKTDRERKNK